MVIPIDPDYVNYGGRPAISRREAAFVEMANSAAALVTEANRFYEVANLSYTHAANRQPKTEMIENGMRALGAQVSCYRASVRRYLALSKTADARKAARAARLRAEADAIDGGVK